MTGITHLLRKLLGVGAPAMPMARPTSDSLSAGASLVPSPVTATIWPSSFSSCTSSYLSLGELRASTCARGRVSTAESHDALQGQACIGKSLLDAVELNLDINPYIKI